jgi:hypothetical protein
MKKLSLTTLALVLAATPLAAQITSRDRTTARTRAETIQDAIEAARRGTVYDTRDGRTASTRGSAKVPPGHLPPRGMCRVWIDGVPPGQQPGVTSCAQAERDRYRYSNARVIYGDRESFPGKGKGKHKNVERDDDSIYDRIYGRDRSDDRYDDDRDDRDDRDRTTFSGKGQSKAMKAQAKAQGKGQKKSKG